jgi:hypothetical protein
MRCSAIEKAFGMDTQQYHGCFDCKVVLLLWPFFQYCKKSVLSVAFKFTTSHNLSSYVPPSYNKLRTTLLKQERAHVDSLLDRIKSAC